MKNMKNMKNMKKRNDKDPSAVALGQKGGKARSIKLSPEQRKEIAQKAARARWSRAKSRE
jgi:RNase adaptor protein for sRNA GlmZ degradation